MGGEQILGLVCFLRKVLGTVQVTGFGEGGRFCIAVGSGLLSLSLSFIIHSDSQQILAGSLLCGSPMLCAADTEVGE